VLPVLVSAVLGLSGCSLLSGDSTSSAGPTSPSGASTPSVKPTGNVVIVTEVVTVTEGQEGAGDGQNQTKADGVERIVFAPGATSESVQGVTKAGRYDAYEFGASGGQTLRMTLDVDGGMNYGVTAPDGSVLKSADDDVYTFETTLPADGFYTIDISARDTGTPFTMTVEIV
jgi:hypothetical protein